MKKPTKDVDLEATVAALRAEEDRLTSVVSVLRKALSDAEDGLTSLSKRRSARPCRRDIDKILANIDAGLSVVRTRLSDIAQ